jgi:inosine-uridine nucleoside N-ribohydrolase
MRSRRLISVGLIALLTLSIAGVAVSLVPSAGGASAGPSDTFDSNVLDPAKWIATSNGSTVAAANQELEITHPSGSWTKGSLQTATTYDQTATSVQVQMKRAANAGKGGSTFGETSLYLQLDATHYVYFFVASNTLTAWVNKGSGEQNLTPSWPAYNSTSQQWLRFRESAGTLSFEYASGASSPGTWTVLASIPDPFALTAVTYKIIAGSNVASTDIAQFDNVSSTTTGGTTTSGATTTTAATTTTGDTTPPSISAVGAGSVTASSASLSWTTNEASDSQVDYGLTNGYGSSTALNTSLVTSHAQALSGLGANTPYHYRVKSRDAAGNLATSGDFTFTTQAAAGGPPPVIVDTDIFSDADDVGALAIAFGLQLRGEANVIAIGVNTRTSRPSVATTSWKCAAAIAQFYGFGGIPIGSDMPDNGTDTNTVDFVGPCAAFASASTPAPDTAVNVYRRALVGQADGSVVMVGTGYEENLAALLASPADSISPLNGHDLVAQKVKTLVLMGGGYPSRPGENNLQGNPAAAQAVASTWPTKIVWAGYEVGDALLTGRTVSTTHPANSPVRAAYEAFVGPAHSIFSYDLAAVYHAIRPADPLLTEVGPGTNAVNGSGGNTFTPGSGNQFYLTLANANSLDSAIETLLDTLPSSGDTTPPVISAVTAGSVTASGATVSWTTNEASDSQVDYGPTSGYGSSSGLNTSLVTNHAQTLSGLAANTPYHYRVKSRDAAGNLATSGDFTFTTGPGSGSPGGPSDTFDSNFLDPAKWTVITNGSTVAAANQELEITHPSGSWSKGTLQTATPYDQTGKSVQLQLKRAANAGKGGTTYGETSIYLQLDATHYVYFFVASNTLTAWVNKGSGEQNLTPTWPAYNSTNQQWLRFRESAGTFYFEYASGTTSPGTWKTLASIADPFALTAVTFKIIAGSNVASSDMAQFDNVSTL